MHYSKHAYMNTCIINKYALHWHHLIRVRDIPKMYLSKHQIGVSIMEMSQSTKEILATVLLAVATTALKAWVKAK